MDKISSLQYIIKERVKWYCRMNIDLRAWNNVSQYYVIEWPTKKAMVRKDGNKQQFYKVHTYNT